MNAIPSDYQCIEKSGQDYYLVRLWILIYNGGALTTWDKSVAIDNMLLAQDVGETPYLTSKEVVVSLSQLPCVYRLIKNKERSLVDNVSNTD